ncbi:MAG: RNA polymerase sigma factor, partial [Acutalibacteraceae bacterium]
MNRQDAERITTEYLKPVYGFALKRCADMQDAEDLSQEIVMKVFRSLLSHDDIEDIGKFVWTAAHNALANYYRDCGRAVSGVSVDDMAEFLHDFSADVFADIEFKETAGKLHREIAYLSKMQRKIIIAYYYENKKQS